MSYEHRQPCERPQRLPQTSNELAKKCRDPARSCVHTIIINPDCETDQRDVHSQHLWQQWRFFRASIEVWQNVLPEFIDTQLQTAARLAYLMLIVCSMSARIKAIFISGRVRESASLQSALYIRPPWYQFNQYNFMILVPHMRIYTHGAK